ncbi:unnamed protein product [Pieris brassicae]|uniref:Carboxylic ester hydrolase n=1 Tax=Pieris brassicae TaxID=7116 RepID=A0A9P0XHD1_PIEBR|nr:unnamed protein product [Pieris brassicae]
MNLFLICVFSLIIYTQCNVRIDPLVLIDQGLVRGLISSDGSYSSFLGIPYAQVDISNPFGDALAHPGFDDEVFNAHDGTKQCPQSIMTSERARCSPQSNTSGEETLDCLRLNIYVPTNASSQNPLAVLVWIHGGIYDVGSAGNYGPENLVEQGIIVVTINYRLGPYGFMCLDVPSIAGNQGLKDQYLALRWIRNHIRAFGGNPYNVTIGGQSAGGASVLLHLYSKKEKLYNKVIAQSGVPQNLLSFVEVDINSAIKLASHLGYNATDTEKALGFLSNASHESVSRAAANMELKFRPCKERSFSGIESFIDTDPYTFSNKEKVKDTPIFIGQTSKEHLGSQANNGDDNYNTDPFYDNIREYFKLKEEDLLEAAQTVRHFYIGDLPVSSDVISQLESFTSDFIYNHPVDRAINDLLKEMAYPVYEYEFRYVGNKDIEGAPHCEELKYLFQFYDEIVEPNEQNQLMIKRITKLWSNFVKYGNPTPDDDQLFPVKWTPVSKESRPYMIIDSELKIEHRVNKERMAFWNLFYKAYGQYNKFSIRCNFK